MSKHSPVRQDAVKAVEIASRLIQPYPIGQVWHNATTYGYRSVMTFGERRTMGPLDQTVRAIVENEIPKITAEILAAGIKLRKPIYVRTVRLCMSGGWGLTIPVEGPKAKDA